VYLDEIVPDTLAEFTSPYLASDGTSCLEFYYQVFKGYLEVLNSTSDLRKGKALSRIFALLL
jgi:hypothetical protein